MTLTLWHWKTLLSDKDGMMAFSILVWNLVLLGIILGFAWAKKKFNSALAWIAVVYYVLFLAYFTVLEFSMSET